MKRPLIIIHQKSLVQCDNPTCDYTVPNPTGNPNENIDQHLNVPCPKCGENLLTEEDLKKYKKALSIINFINKWFSWLNIFSPKNAKYERNATYHTRDGFKL